MPQTRSLNKDQTESELNAFIWFYSRSKTLLNESGMTSVHLCKEGYRFRSLSTDTCFLHVLFSDAVKVEDTDALCNEIIVNCMREHYL